MQTRTINTFTLTLQSVTETIHEQQPQISDTMATAYALLAMAEFREKVESALKDERSLQAYKTFLW
jgi:hypothetical protein